MKPSKGLVFMIFLVLAFAVFGRGVLFPFLNWDDPMYVTENPRVTGQVDTGWLDIWDPRPALQGEREEYLPFLESVYRILYFLGQGSPVPFHVAGIFVHVLASLLLFLWISGLGLSRKVCFISSAIFLVHPLHVESVVWVSGLKDPLWACFLFGGLIFFQKSERFGGALWWGSWACMLLACLAKGTAIVFVPLAFLTDVQILGRPLARSLRRLMPHALLAVIVSVLVWKVALANQVMKPYLEGSGFTTFLTMTEVMMQYLAKSLLPLSLSAHYKPIPITSMGDFRFIVSAGVILVWVFAVISLRRKSKWGIFCAAWVVIGLLPVMNILPLSIQMADRYMYVSLLGVTLALALIWVRGLAGHRFFWMFTVLLIGVYAALGFARVAVWRSDRALWTDVVAKSPHNVMAWNNFGKALFMDGEIEHSSLVFRKLTRIASWKKEAWNNYGRTQLLLFQKTRQMSFLDEAEKSIREALKRDARYVSAINNLAIVFWEKGLASGNMHHLIEAQTGFQKALILDPHYGPAKRNVLALERQMKNVKPDKGPNP